MSEDLDLAALLRPAEAGALLSVEALREAVARLARPVRGREELPLQACAGRVVAQTVTARRPLPVFDHSAMDGYAMAFAEGGAAYRLVGRIAAGDAPAAPLAPGSCARIFTGAPVPAGADAVLMQEYARVADDLVFPTRSLAKGENIRRAGEDVAAGETLVEAGTMLDARHIGLLAAAGFARLSVYARPRVAVLSIGAELRPAGQDLPEGAIFDANRPMLLALLARAGVDLTDAGLLPDQPEILRGFLAGAHEHFDLLVTSGGTSAGEEDRLAEAISLAGGQAAQAALAVKPGKPALLGLLRDLRIIGLPGNPFAALTAGLLFARPLAQACAGAAPRPLRPEAAVAGFAYDRKPGRAEFFPAAITARDGAGRPVIDRLGRGGSARLKPLIPAGGLGLIRAEQGAIGQGDLIGFLPFQTAFIL